MFCLLQNLIRQILELNFLQMEKRAQLQNRLQSLKRAPLDGLSNPNTAPGDVNPFIPDSILVPAGYSVDFFGNEQTQVQTLNETFSSYEKFTSQFNSQDDSENSDPLNTPVDVQPVSNSEKGTLSISVEISE